MVAGWNLLTNDAVAKRKVREIRAGVTEDDDPVLIEVSFYSHTLDALTLDVEVEGSCPEGVVCLRVDVVSVPSGLHFSPQGGETRWHVTGGMVDGVPELRKVPNLVTAEEAKVMSGPLKPSRVEAGPETDTDMGTVVGVDEVEALGPNNVTAAEIAMARAEAKAMREGERRVEFRERGGPREDFSSLYPRWPGGNEPVPLVRRRTAEDVEAYREGRRWGLTHKEVMDMLKEPP